MKKKFKLLLMLSTIISLISCNKRTVEINPHDGVLNIDCRNLVVRNVIFSSNNKIVVSIANICTATCEQNAYTGVLMIDRNNDTLALTPCFTCLASPKNNTVQDYELDTKLTSLPELKNIRYVMKNVCEEITYKPK